MAKSYTPIKQISETIGKQKNRIVDISSSLPKMDKEVAKETVKQFSHFADSNKNMFENVAKINKDILDSNDKSSEHVFKGYEKLLDAVIEKSKDKDISSDEFVECMEYGFKAVEGMDKKDTENKEHNNENMNKIFKLFAGIAIVSVAVLGVNVKTVPGFK